MRCISRLIILIVALTLSKSASAAERVIWQLGKQDNSSYEFQPYGYTPGTAAPGVTLDIHEAAK